MLCYENVVESRGSVRKVFASLDRDILHPNHPGLEIPIVAGKSVTFPENSSDFLTPAKAYGLREKSTPTLAEIIFCHDEGKKHSATCLSPRVLAILSMNQHINV